MTVMVRDTDSRLWIPPIHKTIATEGQGIPEVAESIARHATHLQQTGEWAARDRARLVAELEMVLGEALKARFHQTLAPETYNEIVEKVSSRDLSPWEAVKVLLNGSSG
jgi:LAO/AO transport system kinase